MQIQVERTIDAPPERVFSILVDPDRVPEWRPSIERIAERSGPIDRPGTTFVTRYRGRTPDSHGTVLESEPPRLHVLAGHGAVEYNARVALEPEGAGTRLRFDLTVRIPGGPLGRLAERAFLARKVERDSGAEFDRLKELAERPA